MPTHASASPFFRVAVEGSGAPSVIDAPYRKSAAVGGRDQARPPDWQSAPGACRQVAPPDPRSARPSHTASPPASASGGGLARDALRDRLAWNRTVLARAGSAPRRRHRARSLEAPSRHRAAALQPEAARKGCASGSPSLQSTSRENTRRQAICEEKR